MEETIFKAQRRQVLGKQVRALRRQGLLPAVLYGNVEQPVPISLDLHSASKILPRITSTHLVTVDLEGEKLTGLVREKQRDPVTSVLLHVDFEIVSMTEKLRAAVPIVLEGEAPAIRTYQGIITPGTDRVEVECLPGDLPERIVVDLSVLEEIGDIVRVSDLKFADAVQVWTPLDEMVVMVTAPAGETAEEAAEAAEAAAEKPEVMDHGKKDESEE
jgi:large subunit ribosomal protein L25